MTTKSTSGRQEKQKSLREGEVRQSLHFLILDPRDPYGGFGTGTTEPLGCNTNSETSQGNQRFPRTISPPEPGDSPIYTCNNP